MHACIGTWYETMINEEIVSLAAAFAPLPGRDQYSLF